MTGLHWIDAVVVACYVMVILSLGAYAGYRQRKADEYFVGNRSMNPLLIGVSMFATLFSTISFLSTPGEIIQNGPAILTGALTIPLTYFIVSYGIVPIYMRFKVTSAYELLESELGLASRVTGALLFIVMRLVWMAALIYFASDAMMVMLGLDAEWLPAVTFATGAVAVSYSSLGGMRAVVITDLLQFLLLFGGALMVVATVTFKLGDFSWFPTEWNQSWDTQPLVGSPTVRITVLGTVVHITLWWICTAGSDQTAIQRFMATGNARAARRSFLVNSLAGIAVSVVLALVGFSLLAFYQQDPDHLGGLTIAKDGDRLFPYFISHHLPVGVSGLVLSGMFAAAMSSLDSGINSITAVVMKDFVERFRTTPLEEARQSRYAKWVSLSIGLGVVLASSFMQHVPGNFLEVSQRTVGLFVPPLFILFFQALYPRRRSQAGALFGCLASFVVACLVGLWPGPDGNALLSFQWILASSMMAGISVGWLVNLRAVSNRVT